MYHSVLKVLKNVGLSFSTLSFKLASVYVLPQSSDLFTKRYAKQKHPGCKKGAGQIRSSPTFMQLKAFISAEAKKSPIKDVSNYLNDIQ